MRVQNAVGSLFLLLVAGVLAVSAISRQDAGVHDWHRPHIGVPHSSLTNPALAPRLHYPAGRKNSAVAVAVYTGTKRNVLAALEPKQGEITWRHLFPQEQQLQKFVLDGENILALSGPGGSHLDLFSATSGHLIWSLTQHSLQDGLLPEPGSLATDAVFYHPYTETAALDVISLANGKEIRRIDGRTGQTIWRWTLNTPDEPTTQIHAILPPAPGSTSVYLLSIRRLPGSYTLLTSSLSVANGEVISAPTKLKGATLESLTTSNVLVFPATPNAKGEAIVYLDKAGNVHSAKVAESSHAVKESVYKGKSGKGKYERLVQVSLEQKHVFVASRTDGTASIISVSDSGDIVSLHEWHDSVSHAVFSGHIDREGFSHVSRYSISRVLGLASLSTVSLDKTAYNDAGLIFAATFPYSAHVEGQIVHAIAEVAPRKSPSLMFRTLVMTEGGSIQGWLGPNIQFTRNEGLAHLGPSSGADSPEDVKHSSIAFFSLQASKGRPQLASAETPSLMALSSPSVLARELLTRSSDLLRSLGVLPQSKALAVAGGTSSSSGRDWLSDAFGYRKIAIVGSTYGKLYALDHGDGGKILWENLAVHVNEASAGQDGQTFKILQWKKIAVFDKRADGRILVVALAEVLTYQNKPEVHAFYLDGLTGKPFIRGPFSEIVLRSSISDAFVLHGSADPTIALVDALSSKIHLVSPPEKVLGNSGAKETTPLPEIVLPGLTSQGAVQGLHAVLETGEAARNAEVVWQLSLGEDEKITSIAKQTNGKIASVGRVLGNRSTLYKYLNPHFMAVATVSSGTQSAHIYLVDTVTGAVVWSASHIGNVDAASGVHVTLAENRVMYAYADKKLEGAGTALVSLQLFENRTRSADSTRTTFSSFVGVKPYAVSQAFVFPGRITSMAISQTLHGITTKSLLVSTAQDQVVAIPGKLLDPRRPMGKPSKFDMEEYLVPYDPVINVDPKWVITHVARVTGIQGISTSPTLLESTSQVLIWGLDMFGTSVSPSGRFDVLSREFNKSQLIATTSGLMALIAILRPIVRKKQLKERWYPAT